MLEYSGELVAVLQLLVCELDGANPMLVFELVIVFREPVEKIEMVQELYVAVPVLMEASEARVKVLLQLLDDRRTVLVAELL